MAHDTLNAERASQWYKNYGSQTGAARRKRTMPEKLRRLGLDGKNKNLAILDVCCGYGECLTALYELGYRNLHGIDINIDDQLARDPRFKVVSADARNIPLAGDRYDYVLNIHALHHLGNVDDLKRFRDECFRMLKPGGRLGIIDFANTFSIKAAFWWFRQGRFMWTPYLKYMEGLVKEEWPFLQHYLPQWPEIRKLWLDGPFEIVGVRPGIFYFNWILKKPS